MTLTLLNPAIASENLGDYIIEQAVKDELGRIMPDQQIIDLPTQEIVGRRSFRLARTADYRIVGGTNLLSSHMLRYRQWKIGIFNARRIGPSVLMGVGWWQYQDDPDLYTRLVLQSVLSADSLHSVRDNYTKEKLAGLGFNNVLNTSCPTVWSLTPEHCQTIPLSRSKEVVVTITDYHSDPKNDRTLFQMLHETYDRVFFWPQGSGDLRYAAELGALSGVTTIHPSVAAFDALLSERGVDFVGTRLHAGIRAMQKGRRAIIVSVDNRSVEISRDIGLPVVQRGDNEALARQINSDWETRLTLPTENIAKWKSQFKHD